MPRKAFRTTQWIIKLQNRTFDEKRYKLTLMKVLILELDYQAFQRYKQTPESELVKQISAGAKYLN
jgi:hypothetical protein